MIDSRQRAELAVVLCHGYGAPGHDLLGVVVEWIESLGNDASRIRFVCPIAPLTLAELGMPDARAWWPLNMARLMEAVQAKRFDELHRQEPPGIAEARRSLETVIEKVVQDITRKEAVPGEAAPLALGGFSQGAMLTMDTTLRGSIPKPGLLMQFSGTVVCQPSWEAAMVERLSDVRVYQSHGSVDPILPFESAKHLRDLLNAAEADSQFHEFVGPHTIDSQSIVDTAGELKKLLEKWEY